MLGVGQGKDRTILGLRHRVMDQVRVLSDVKDTVSVIVRVLVVL